MPYELSIMERETDYEGLRTIKNDGIPKSCLLYTSSEILNSLALHWEETEKAYMSEFIRGHRRSLSPD